MTPRATSDHRYVADPAGLERPHLVVMLTGWIDAAEAGERAMKVLVDECQADPLVEFEDDAFIDFRARRPVMSLRDSLNAELRWASINLLAGHDRQGKDVLLLCGPEPDSAWHRFSKLVAQLAVDLGVSSMVGLGAYPYATPHTRAPRLSVTTPSAALRDRMPTRRTTIDLPAGMNVVLEHAMHAREIPAMTLWVQVPHYVATMPYPAASVTLLDALNEHGDVHVDGAELRSEALEHRDRLDRLVSTNDEHQAMIAQLEQVYDEDEQPAGPPAVDPAGDAANLPSGDELAGEIERFLRDQGKNG